MKVAGKPYRTLALAPDGWSVDIIDQTLLPGEFRIARLRTLDDAATAIRTMQVRGAPLIGVAAAYGLCLALRSDPSDAGLASALATLGATRPTAVNLRAALERMETALRPLPAAERAARSYQLAGELAEEDVALCAQIGGHAEAILRGLASRYPERPLQVLTHCNAGWLAAVDWGTALAGVYRAHDAGLPLHVWVDETRPRNQGRLTAWELGQHGVPHTLIVDGAAASVLAQGRVDVVLVGTDRTTRRGDVANKIGTYPLALAAREAGVPFYVAAPSPSLDWTLAAGERIPIEERSPREVCADPGIQVHNPAFDVTPARLVTGLITERGVSQANEAGLLALFPERRA